MNASSFLLLLLVLACPLMMAWMMRGGHGHGHGHGGHNHDRDAHQDAHAPLVRERSTRGLHELRDEIDQMIEEREEAEREQSERELTAATRR